MRFILLAVLLLGFHNSIAQKKVKANGVMSVLYEVTRNEYGRKWARKIHEWRNYCYPIEKIKEYDTIYVYIDRIPWDAYYCEFIQIGKCQLGFSVNYNIGELNSEIDKYLLSIHNILSTHDELNTQKYILSKEDGDKIFDLSPINVFIIIKNKTGYYYSCESINFMNSE